MGQSLPSSSPPFRTCYAVHESGSTTVSTKPVLSLTTHFISTLHGDLCVSVDEKLLEIKIKIVNEGVFISQKTNLFCVRD